MNRQTLASLAIATTFAATLQGCYVVPIDSRFPHDPSRPIVISQQGHGHVVTPAPQVVPVSIQARLYPLNEMAGQLGVLSGLVTDSLNGHASFSVNVAGESLQGEASRVPDNYPGFGNVHQQVYGSGRMPSGQRGVASAAGSRGNYVNCEYTLNSASRGTGACLFSNGAKYQLHFGG